MARGKSQGRQKKAKKGGPKKALSTFMFFSKTRRGEILKEKPELRSNVTELSKLIGADWRNLTNSEKEPYQRQHEADKERYAKEKEDYDTKMAEEGEQGQEEEAPKKTKKVMKKKKKEDSEDDEDEADEEELAEPDDSVSDEEETEENGGHAIDISNGIEKVEPAQESEDGGGGDVDHASNQEDGDSENEEDDEEEEEDDDDE